MLRLRSWGVTALSLAALVGVSGSGCRSGALEQVPLKAQRAAIEGYVLSPEETLMDEMPVAADLFGLSLALDGSRLATSELNANEDRYDVFVYERAGGAWSRTTKLTATDVSPFRWDTANLAFGADELYVGTAQAADAGAVLVFDTTSWQQIDRISPPATTPEEFGYAVAVDGDSMIVGDPDYGDIATQEGAAHIYAKESGSWTYKRTLEAPISDESTDFGWDVEISGDVAVVADAREDSFVENGGAVYVFRRSSGGDDWSLDQTLRPDQSYPEGRFGLSIALSGDTLAVGAPEDASSGSANGAVHLFRDNGTTFEPLDELLPDGALVSAAGFGVAVDIDGDRLVVGAHPSASSNLAGSAWLYLETSGGWELAEALGVGGDTKARRGHAVAVSGDGVLVGEPGSLDSTSPGKLSFWTFRAQFDNGAVCANGSVCQSGFCVDGVCCDTECGDDCYACSADKKGRGSDGTCEPVVEGPEPDAACPPDPDCPSDLTCNGAGKCVCDSKCTEDGEGRVLFDGTIVDCGDYVCVDGQCLGSCDGDDDCQSGYQCLDGQCEEQDCTEEFCCPEPCDACWECTRVGTTNVGECTPVAKGEPGGCAEDATCPRTPVCDGVGRCDCQGGGTVRCSEDGLSRVDENQQEVSCSPYRCGANGCFNSCTSAAECAPDAACGSDNICRTAGASSGGSSDGGCGCHVGSDAPVPGWIFLGLGLAAGWRRRRS